MVSVRLFPLFFFFFNQISPVDILETLSMVSLNLPLELNLCLVPELSTDVTMGNTHLIQCLGINKRC